ncbi:hypothetical protein [Embleya sp. NBC_00896]|uniref:hypothetical protein n=1 Tax=Embleya sp. NBC_00896 TaxID=2975961 RepID=UPI0038636FAA|nr:hypothetical protein OG928_19705 [Embleya sp. NBC_00896]
MNFESDHLVLQYLGQVGDAAQRRLRPADRARLVERLRSQINSERERLNAHTTGTVQVILDRLGSPDSVVGHELYRLGDLRDTGADDGVGAMSMRGSRYATVARQMGFRADATPIPAVLDPSRPQPGTPAPRVSPDAGPPTLAETAAGTSPGAAPAATQPTPLADPDDEPLWWRTPPEGPLPPERPDPGSYGDGSLHAPAYPIGVASDTSATWDDDALTEPTPAIGIFGGPGSLRTQVREVFAIALMAVGAITASTVVVLLGVLVVFTAGAWSLKERRFAAFYIPGGMALAFAIGMWLRATGNMGTDLTRDQAWDRYGELLPAMVRVAAVAVSLYLLWRLNRRQNPA